MSELQLRVISAIVLAALALLSTWAGGLVFTAVWAVLALLVLQEWMTITRAKPDFMLWGSGGMVYAVGLFFSVIALRNGMAGTEGDHLGMIAILFLFAVVWASDVFAYFVGRALGGPKLAPRISPNKTWSGFCGGLSGGMLAGTGLLAAFGYGRLFFYHAALSLVLSLASIAGDLFESAFKRRFGVKDSGRLIPGHGGFMDRLDGFIFAAILAAIIGVSVGGVAQASRGLLLFSRL